MAAGAGDVVHENGVGARFECDTIILIRYLCIDYGHRRGRPNIPTIGILGEIARGREGGKREARVENVAGGARDGMENVRGVIEKQISDGNAC